MYNWLILISILNNGLKIITLDVLTTDLLVTKAQGLIFLDMFSKSLIFCSQLLLVEENLHNSLMTTLLIDSFLVVVLLFLTSNASFVFCSVFTACFKTSTCALNYINKEQVDN